MINQYIKELLIENNRVIIPDFGAFIARTSPKVAVADQLSHKTIVFNDILKFNDGLLVNHIIKIENIDLTIALQKITNYVQEIHNEFTKGNDYYIEELGYLHHDQRGNTTLKMSMDKPVEDKINDIQPNIIENETIQIPAIESQTDTSISNDIHEKISETAENPALEGEQTVVAENTEKQLEDLVLSEKISLEDVTNELSEIDEIKESDNKPGIEQNETELIVEPLKDKIIEDEELSNTIKNEEIHEEINPETAYQINIEKSNIESEESSDVAIKDINDIESLSEIAIAENIDLNDEGKIETVETNEFIVKNQENFVVDENLDIKEFPSVISSDISVNDIIQPPPIPDVQIQEPDNIQSSSIVIESEKQKSENNFSPVSNNTENVEKNISEPTEEKQKEQIANETKLSKPEKDEKKKIKKIIIGKPETDEPEQDLKKTEKITEPSKLEKFKKKEPVKNEPKKKGNKWLSIAVWSTSGLLFLTLVFMASVKFGFIRNISIFPGDEWISVNQKLHKDLEEYNKKHKDNLALPEISKDDNKKEAFGTSESGSTGSFDSPSTDTAVSNSNVATNTSEGSFGSFDTPTDTKNSNESTSKEKDQKKEVSNINTKNDQSVSNVSNVGNSGKFVIVAGSFKTKDAADRFIVQLKQKGFTKADYVGEKNGMHITCYGSYNNRNEANTELQKLQQKGVQTWILSN